MALREKKHSEPIATGTIPMKVVKTTYKGKTYENVKGTIRMPDGKRIAVEWNRDEKGSVDKKSGLKIAGWLKCAVFEGDGSSSKY